MNNNDNKVSTEKEIDLLEVTQLLISKRKFILKIAAIGFVIGLIIAFSIPKEYKTTVVLAPSSNSSTSMGNAGGMGALAAMAGVNLNQTTQDEISPNLYPSILSSTPFISSLSNIRLKDIKNNIDTTLFVYIKDKQKRTWWSNVLRMPFRLLSLFSSKDKAKIENNSEINTELSKDQILVFGNLKNRLNIVVDKKTNLISLSVEMQNPDISAFIADSVTSYLQKQIISYRTQKAREDLEFTEKLYSESKEGYYKAQQNYATFSDGNLDIISARYGATKDRLENEMNLAYNVYNQMAQQLQMAKVKVQDTKPVYTIIEPAIAPSKPEKPNKKLIVAGFLLVAIMGSCSYILFKNYFK